MMRKKVPSLGKQTEGQAVYWIRSEAFELGVVPTVLPASFAPATLLKVPSELPDDKPTITRAEWLAVARKCLGLPDELAHALFETFETLYNDDASKLLDETRQELVARQRNLIEEYRAAGEAPLSLFLVFLFIQLYQRNNGAPLLSPRQELPLGSSNGGPAVPGSTTSPVTALSPTRAMALSARVTDHEDQLQFVKRHLYDMLCLLSPNKYKVSFEQIQELSFLLTEGENLATPCAPFGTLMPFWQRKDGVIDQTQLVDISVIQTFINQRLVHNVTVYPPVELPGTRATSKILWPQEAKVGLAPREANWTSASCAVKSISGVTKSLFVRTAQDMHSATRLVRIFCNHQANIYLLLPLQAVSIFGCTNCTIILGTVQKLVSVEYCEKVRVVCCSRALRVSNSVDTRVYCCVNTRPVICAGNRSVDLAPYNTHYPSLEHHLQLAGVNPRLNYWDTVIAICKEKNYQLLPPELYSSSVIPFQLPGPTHCNPCPLPLEYTKELRNKVVVAERMCEQLRQVSAKGDREMLKQIHSHFREWLVTSGNLRHVLDLLYYEEREYS